MPLRPARPCSRAATFGASPITARSWARPSPTISPTITRPVAIPIRTAISIPLARPSSAFSPDHRLDDREPGPDRALGVALQGLGIAEIDQDAVAHVFGDEALVLADDGRAALLIGPDHVLQILGIEPARERGRIGQIAEHHGQRPPLGVAGYACETGGSTAGEASSSGGGATSVAPAGGAGSASLYAGWVAQWPGAAARSAIAWPSPAHARISPC